MSADRVWIIRDYRVTNPTRIYPIGLFYRLKSAGDGTSIDRFFFNINRLSFDEDNTCNYQSDNEIPLIP